MSFPPATTIAFADLPTPPRRAVDIVSLRLGPLFAAHPPAAATNWRRRILVLCARQMSVSGTSLAVLALDDAALTSGIARILLLAGSLQAAADLLDDVIAAAEVEYDASPVPPADFTPLPSATPSPAPATPSPQPVPPPDAQQQLLLAAVAAMGQSMGLELARQLSSSLAPHGAAAAPALQQTLTRTLEASRGYFSSSESSVGEGGQPGLPVEVRWPRGHPDLPLLLRTLEVFARAYLAVAQDPRNAAAAIITSLRASGRSVSVDFVSGLLNQETPSALSLAEIAVVADLTLPESALALLRLARVARPRTAAEVTSARKGEYISAPPGFDLLPIREPRPAHNGAHRSAPYRGNDSTARTSPTNHHSPRQPQQNNQQRQGAGRRDTQVSP